jgi:hypothetical protein
MAKRIHTRSDNGTDVLRSVLQHFTRAGSRQYIIKKLSQTVVGIQFSFCACSVFLAGPAFCF